MRQVTLTLSLPWAKAPFATNVYGRNARDIEPQIKKAVERYARRFGVGVSAVDYETRWGAVAR